METNLEIKNNLLVIHLPSELDHHTVKDIREQADDILKQEELEGIVFDFSDTVFMDSSGVGMIMGRYRTIAKNGGFVGVTKVNSAINRILEISGLYKIVQVY